MKKLLAILSSLSLTTTLATSVASCSKSSPEWADDQEIFSVQPQHSELELDEDGKQVNDFNFNLNYLLNSPTTGDVTNVQIQAADIAADDENPSDDTRRYGKEYWTIGEIENSNADDEPQVNYYLQFNQKMIEKLPILNEPFNLALNFKGNYFANEEFSVTLYFQFKLINNYRADLKRDLKDYIPEEQRDLGMIKKLNDVTPPDEAQLRIKAQVFETFKPLFEEVDLNFNFEAKEVQVIAKPNSDHFKGEVILTYLHDKNPELLPDVSQGVDLNTLTIDRLAFSKLDLNDKIQVIKNSLKKWYSTEKGPEYTLLYFQYFKIEETIIDVDTIKVLIKFETPWPEVNKDFEAKFSIPYTEMKATIPENLFAEKLLDMNPDTTDEEILSKLNQKAKEKIPDFDEHFEFGTLDVGKQTIEIVTQVKEKNQIYEPSAKLQLDFNVQKLNLEDLIGEQLKDYSFDAGTNGLYYMTLRELAFSKMRENISEQLKSNELEQLITLENEFNEQNFDTTDPDNWMVKITPSLKVQRYVTGELNFQYHSPIPSELEKLVIPGETYLPPGYRPGLHLETPWLVSSQKEIQENYLKILNKVWEDNPFTKWVIINNPDKFIDVLLPSDFEHNYDLFGAEKVQPYLGINTYTGDFYLAKLDLASYFKDGINISTPLDSKTPETIAKELYKMIIGEKDSDFTPIPNLQYATEVVNVQINSEEGHGTAQLRVKPNYYYKEHVLNQARITFKIKDNK